jgi:DNA polymerase III subunit alpha
VTAPGFAHLHVHTEYSMLDGLARARPLLDRAAELGQRHLAITDHGNMFGSWEFYHAASQAGVVPILGIEAYVAPESRFHKKKVQWGKARTSYDEEAAEGGKDISGGGKYLHMTMWAQNAQGLRNLFRMQSEAFLTGQYGKPRMDLELMEANAAGIMVSTGCPSGGVQTRLRLGQEAEAIAYAGKLKEIFGDGNVFCELMDHGVPIEREARDGLLRVAKAVDLPFLVTNDSHYVVPSQSAAHDALLAVGVGKNLDDPRRFRFNGDGYYLKTADEMYGIDLSEAWQDGCRNTLVLAERVVAGAYAEVFKSRDLAPEFDVPAGETQISWLRKEASRGVERRYGSNPSPEVLDRVEYELKTIEAMGFPAYFLVVADLCNYARSRNIIVGPGRGSATGSMVAYVLGITELDPIQHGLIFERFLNPERVSMPDIDLDFDDRNRDQMIRYTVEKYGSSNVAQIITFGKIKAKNAIKDANRILGFPFNLGDQITKTYPPDKFGKSAPLSCIFDEKHPQYPEASETRKLLAENPDVKKILEVARGIEGLTRSSGVHAAGVIICREPLIDVVPLNYRESDGTVIVGFSFAECEELGLLKMDYLGLRNLTVIADALHNVRANQGVEVDLEALTRTFDDKPTYELLGRGDTLGVFQLDGGAMRALLKLLKPTNFVEVAAVIALYRPGPMAANTHVNFALRKNGQQEITPIHPELKEALEPILGESYHLVVFQEQVMRIATDLAGYTLGGADNLRRAMGKKKRDVLEKAMPEFIAGMGSNGYSEEAAKAVWDVMLPFSEYGFNKSHAAGYAYVSYWTAYLKANYPAEFMAALLTSVGDDKDKRPLYLGEARRMGVKVLPPDVNESEFAFTAVGDDVRFGLGAIRGLGENVVQAIVDGRKGDPYTSFLDFLTKVPIAGCTKKVVEALIKAGAFDSLGHTRASLIAVHELAVDAAMAIKRQQASGQFDLFGDLGGEDEAPSLAIGIDIDQARPEWDKKMLLGFEREMLGLYVSAHPLDHARAVLERERTHGVAELLAEPENGRQVTLTGLITNVERRISKTGKMWAIVTVEDLEAAVEVLFFATRYSIVEPYLVQDSVVSVSGKVNLRDEAVSIFGEDLRPLEVPTAGAAAAPIVLTISVDRVLPNLVSDLKIILSTHPGTIPVRLRLVSRDKSLLMDLPDHRVNPENGFVADVKSLLGADALAMPPA